MLLGKCFIGNYGDSLDSTNCNTDIDQKWENTNITVMRLLWPYHNHIVCVILMCLLCVIITLCVCHHYHSQDRNNTSATQGEAINIQYIINVGWSSLCWA